MPGLIDDIKEFFTSNKKPNEKPTKDTGELSEGAKAGIRSTAKTMKKHNTFNPLKAVMDELNESIDKERKSYKRGGMVKVTGPAKLHKGEKVVRKSSRKSNRCKGR